MMTENSGELRDVRGLWRLQTRESDLRSRDEVNIGVSV